MGNFGGFSWRRFTGVSGAKSKISRQIGIPLSRSGRQQKLGRMFSGGGCALAFSTMLIVAIVLLTAFSLSCSKTEFDALSLKEVLESSSLFASDPFIDWKYSQAEAGHWRWMSRSKNGDSVLEVGTFRIDLFATSQLAPDIIRELNRLALPLRDCAIADSGLTLTLAEAMKRPEKPIRTQLQSATIELEYYAHPLNAVGYTIEAN